MANHDKKEIENEDFPRETLEDQKAREKRQIEDRATELREQNRANINTYNNSGLLRDIQSRQCEVLEKLGEMKVSIDNIEIHTTVMNSELGVCQKDITKAKEDIQDLKDKFVLKISWKQVAAMIGTTATILGIVQIIIHFFM